MCLAGEGSGPVVDALASAVSAEPADRPTAHELAWLLFAAAAPEPLRLVHGDDEVTAVTYRLRAAAGRPPDGPPPWRWARVLARPRAAVRRVLERSPGPPPEHPTRGKPSAAGRHGGGVVRRGWGSADRGARRDGTGPVQASGGSRTPGASRRALASVAAGVVVLALAAVTTAVLDSDRGTASAPPHVSAPATVGAEQETARSDPRTDARPDPRTDPRAPHTRAPELLAVLADARAKAWREATPALLHAADAPGSAMAARDAADVAEVERAGLRYTGLRYTVADVSTVSATAQRAVLRARVDAGPYSLTAATGSTPRPAAVGVPVLVDLVRTDRGWRLADLRPVR